MREDEVAPDLPSPFESLLSDLSSRFTNLDPGDIDQGDRSLAAPGLRVAGPRSRGVVAMAGRVTGRGHRCLLRRRGSAGYRAAAPGAVPYFVQEMLAGRPVAVSSLEVLPPEADIESGKRHLRGIKSTLCLPLSVGGDRPLAPWRQHPSRRSAMAGRAGQPTSVDRTGSAKCACPKGPTESSLRGSEARLRAGADLAGLAFYEVDFDRATSYADEKFRELCGVPAELMTGLGPVKFWMEHLHPDDYGRVVDKREKLHDGRLTRFSLEYRFLNPVRGSCRSTTLPAFRAVMIRVARSRRTASCATSRSAGRGRRRSGGRSYAEIERLKDRLQAENEYLKAEIRVVHSQGEVAGQSAVIRKVMRLVEQVGSDGIVRADTGRDWHRQGAHRLRSG